MLNRNLFTISFAAMALALPYQQGYPPMLGRPLGLQRFSLDEPKATSAGLPDPLMKDVQSLNDNLKELDQVIQGFSGRAEEALNIEGTSDKVYKSMDKILQQINARPQMTLLEAANIGTAFLEFMPNTAKTLDGFASKKQMFGQLGLVPVVVQELKRQRDQAAALDKAMVDKVPDIAKDTAKDIYGSVKDSFDRIISSYSAGGAAEFGSGKEASAEELEESNLL